MTENIDKQEEFVMWATDMATDFAGGESWHTGQFRTKLKALIAKEVVKELVRLQERQKKLGWADDNVYVDQRIKQLEANVGEDSNG